MQLHSAVASFLLLLPFLLAREYLPDGADKNSNYTAPAGGVSRLAVFQRLLKIRFEFLGAKEEACGYRVRSA